MGTRRKSLETETLISRDQDETDVNSPGETRPRRDVCSSRDVIEIQDVKVQVLLIAIIGLNVIFHVHCF